MSKYRRLDDDEIWQLYKDGEVDRGGCRIPTAEEIRIEKAYEKHLDDEQKRWLEAAKSGGAGELDRARAPSTFTETKWPR